MKESARKNGYVLTIMGRRRFLKEIDSHNRVLREAAERMAVNTPIQGSAADLIKLAMIRVDREYREKQMRGAADPPGARRADRRGARPGGGGRGTDPHRGDGRGGEADRPADRVREPRAGTGGKSTEKVRAPA